MVYVWQIMESEIAPGMAGWIQIWGTVLESLEK